MNTQIIMLASGKGGTGKSTVSVLLGARLAAKGQSVLLVELDSGLRSVDILAGVYGKTVYDIQDVLSGRCDPNKAVVKSQHYPGLSVISAPYEGGQITPEALGRLVRTVQPFFDVILLDTAAGIGDAFQAALSVARRALIVLTPDPIALRDGRIVSDHLYDRGVQDIRLVLNRVTPSSFGKNSVVSHLDECIDTVCAQLIAVIPESAQLQQAALLGNAIPASCKACVAADHLAARILGQRVPLEFF